VGVGLVVRLTVGLRVYEIENSSTGATVGLDSSVGAKVGFCEGCSDGFLVGLLVASSVGLNEG